MLEDNYQEHLKILTNLKDNYWKQLFKKHNKPFNEPSIVVHLPPSIPSQDNGYDCGVFLLSFAKCMIFNKSFDFGTEEMLQLGKITFPEESNSDARTKRKREESNSDARTKRKRSMSKDIPLKKKTVLHPNEQ